MDAELLNQPLDMEDMRDQEEMIENCCLVQRDYLERVLQQYRQETWISQAMREVLADLALAHDKFARLRAAGSSVGVFLEQ
jgi:cytochrome c553